MSLIRTVSGALALLIAWSAAADPLPFYALAPRVEAVKPEQTEADFTAFPDVLVLKLREGSRARLVEGRLVAEPRTEAEDFRLERAGLSAQQVDDELEVINSILEHPPVLTVERMFFHADPAVLETQQGEGEQLAGEELADLDLYHHVVLEAPDPEGVAQLAEELNGFAVVEIAYAQPIPSGAAPDLFPPAGDLTNRQTTLHGAAPAGIEAQYAWTWPGGRGAGVRLVDVETGWTLDHEDLPPVFFDDGWNVGDHQHGTAALGIVAAENNAFGMTGIASDTRIGVASPIPIYNVPAAIDIAASVLDPGDVLLIEQHYPGPTDNAPPCVANCGQFGFVAVENSQGDFDAIRRAVARGVIVIEPAGNGSMNLDAARYSGRFDPNVRHSGAIMVGASVPANQAPQIWSNTGARVDVHAWGDLVGTTGYGTGLTANMRPAAPQDGDARQWYRDNFGGTSSASAIVAAAVASLQGVRLAHGLDRLDSRSMLRLLTATGTPQAASPRNIGPQPNLRAAIDAMHLTRTPARMIHTVNAGNTPGWFEFSGWGCSWYPCIPGPIFTWRNDSFSYLDHPSLNGNPDAVLQVTPRLGLFASNPSNFGVRYDATAGKWTVVDLDDLPVVYGAQYNVVLTPRLRRGGHVPEPQRQPHVDRRPRGQRQPRHAAAADPRRRPRGHPLAPPHRRRVRPRPRAVVGGADRRRAHPRPRPLPRVGARRRGQRPLRRGHRLDAPGRGHRPQPPHAQRSGRGHRRAHGLRVPRRQHHHRRRPGPAIRPQRPALDHHPSRRRRPPCPRLGPRSTWSATWNNSGWSSTKAALA